MPELPKTTTMRRLTLESGDQEDISQSDVAGGTVEILMPMLDEALMGDTTVHIPPTNYWFRATEASADQSDAHLRATFGTASAGDNPLVEMTLRPPGAEDEPAILMTSIGGWIHAVAAGSLGDRPDADRIAYELADLEKCISWTWLEMRGYATRYQNLNSPLEILFSAGGGMLTTIVQEPGSQPEVCFLVQNAPEAVRGLPANPNISLETRLFKIGDVHLVPLVARVGDTWYESWINPYADDGRGFEELEILAAQERVVFLIYDGTSLDPERTVQIANPLAGKMAEMRRVMRDVAPWTMDAFAEARERLYAAYPTPQDLIFGPDLA